MDWIQSSMSYIAVASNKALQLTARQRVSQVTLSLQVEC